MYSVCKNFSRHCEYIDEKTSLGIDKMIKEEKYQIMVRARKVIEVGWWVKILN